MKTLKKMLKPILTDFAPKERFSLRFQDGVEIYEHEFVQTCSVVESGEIPVQAPLTPRLVVIESDEGERGLIAKTRSEVAGLATILNAL